VAITRRRIGRLYFDYEEAERLYRESLGDRGDYEEGDRESLEIEERLGNLAGKAATRVGRVGARSWDYEEESGRVWRFLSELQDLGMLAHDRGAGEFGD
jgi:hypothetical protein